MVLQLLYPKKCLIVAFTHFNWSANTVYLRSDWPIRIRERTNTNGVNINLGIKILIQIIQHLLPILAYDVDEKGKVKVVFW